MLLLDVLVRYPTITLLVVISFLCLRFGGSTIQGRLGALTGFAMAALLLDTAPPPLQIPKPYSIIPKLILVPNLAALWLFCLSLFKDDFKMGRFEWAILFIYSALILAYVLILTFGLKPPTGPIKYITPAFSASLILHLIWTAFDGRKDDLIESRRKGRVTFALLMAAAAAITVTAENLFYDTSPETVDFIRAFVILPIMIWALVWLIELRIDRMLFQPSVRREPAAPQIDPKDRVTHERLIELLEKEKIFTEQGLTIRSLSDRMKVPEHQLRALINQGLGFRNFAEFINGYRLDYAETVLSDPAQARLPVLTIAMDAGFNSLAPFNRAFKAREGKTPTAYRSEALQSID